MGLNVDLIVGKNMRNVNKGRDGQAVDVLVVAVTFNVTLNICGLP
jgi:hypothetical protein